MQLFYEPNIASKSILNEEEARHCIKVLRKQKGDEINVIDGKGHFYNCEIVEANPKRCLLKILGYRAESKKNHYIHIAIAPTKNLDRIEWFVEKAVEIGIDEISFTNCQNSERKIIKTERMEKKAISAMKQSLKASIPIINELQSFDNLVKQPNDVKKFIGFVDMDNPIQLKNVAKPGHKYLVLIGPEGDFSDKEVEKSISNGFEKIGLGKSRLRTETAGLVACHILNVLNDF